MCRCRRSRAVLCWCPLEMLSRYPTGTICYFLPYTSPELFALQTVHYPRHIACDVGPTSNLGNKMARGPCDLILVTFRNFLRKWALPRQRIYSVTKKDSSAPSLKWRDGGATLWRKINASQSQQPLGQLLWLRHQNKVESGRTNYGQVCAAVNCNNCTGTCEGLAFFTFPKDEERYAHFIEFARYATSSIWLSDHVDPACSVAVVLQRRTCIRENRQLFAYKLMCVRIRNIHTCSLTKASNSSTLCLFITGTCCRWNELTLTADSPNQTYWFGVVLKVVVPRYVAGRYVVDSICKSKTIIIIVYQMIYACWFIITIPISIYLCLFI